MITNMIGKGKTAAPGMTEEKQRMPIEQQLMEYARSIREEGLRGETKEAYAARVYAKARSGQKLTADEMSFLARTNPELYQKVLRAQRIRKEMESRLKSCRSKQEAQEVFSAFVGSISEKDPDRDMIIQALNQAFREFQESGEYQRLPETEEEAKERLPLEFVRNGNGYQEAYIAEGAEESFEADA